MTRPTRDEWGLAIARETASRSTCLRRQVGCVLLNSRGHILATGYNGVAAGEKHCNDAGGTDQILLPHMCPGALSPSGTNLDGCRAIHAEQNALMQCRDVWEIETCYVTTSPCMTCVKLLLNTNCTRIVFKEDYAHTAAKVLWVESGREWVQL